jgi:hypothetical protein
MRSRDDAHDTVTAPSRGAFDASQNNFGFRLAELRKLRKKLAWEKRVRIPIAYLLKLAVGIGGLLVASSYLPLYKTDLGFAIGLAALLDTIFSNHKAMLLVYDAHAAADALEKRVYRSHQEKHPALLSEVRTSEGEAQAEASIKLNDFNTKLLKKTTDGLTEIENSLRDGRRAPLMSLILENT